MRTKPSLFDVAFHTLLSAVVIFYAYRWHPALPALYVAILLHTHAFGWKHFDIPKRSEFVGGYQPSGRPASDLRPPPKGSAPGGKTPSPCEEVPYRDGNA